MKQSYLLLSQRMTSNVYILSAREAFIALIPYLILTSTLALLSTFLGSVSGKLGPFSNAIGTINQSVYSLFPLLTLVSLSYFLAKNLNLARVACVALSTVCFISVESQIFLTEFTLQRSGQFAFHPTAILLPFFVAYVMKTLQDHSRFNIIKSISISSHLRHHINLIPPYLLTFIVVTVATFLISPVLSMIFSPVLETLTQSGSYIQAGVRIVMIHLLWFLGIHGDNTYSLLVDSTFLGTELSPNLLIGDLINFFVLTGGSGSGWALVISIFIFSKDDHSKHIAKISMPFALFNINELLIFGLPIVFNPYLIIPFILVPTLTFTVSLLAASVGIIEFVPHTLSWITPPIINTYIASDGDISTVLFQIFMILMGVLIYAPFVKISHLYNDDREIAETLATKLALDQVIDDPTDFDTHNINKKSKTIDIDNIIEEILTGDLLLHYQPIINSHDKMIRGFSTQLRLQRSDGKIIPLDYLHALNRNHVSNVIYTWMLHQLHKDCDQWQVKNFTPSIQVHLDPNTLKQTQIIDGLIQLHHQTGQRLHITLNENTAGSSDSHISTSLSKLHNNDINITLVNFSGPNTRVETLLQTYIDRVEFNSNFFKQCQEERHKNLFIQLCRLCKNMDLEVQICDIETQQEQELCDLAGADFMRGEIFSQALPSTEVYRFCSRWNESVKDN